MGSSSMKLGVMDDGITLKLLADITMTTAILAVEHRQMSLQSYMMMSWDKTMLD